MATRVTHTVRIKHPSKDMGWYIDVEVLDAIITLGPNGEERIYSLTAHTPAVTIIDNTSGGSTNVATDAGEGTTRVSHMEKLTNPADPSQQLIVEVFDAIMLETVNGDQILLQLDNDPTDLNSRATHHFKYKNKGDSSGSQFITLTYTSAITFGGPNEFMIESSGNDGTIDVTPDKDNPPKNLDANPYIVWCNNKDTGDLTQGPWLGDALNSRGQPWQQGLLWWIKNVRMDQPWYFYINRQQPLNFALVGGYTGAVDIPNPWDRVPFFSFVSLAPQVDDDPIPVPPIGFPTLEEAIDQTAADLLAGLIEPGTAYFSQFDFTNKFLFTLTGFDFPDPDDPKAKVPPFQKIAETFEQMYNDTSDTYNQIMQGVVGPTMVETGGVHFKRPESSFKVPLGDPSIPTGLGGIDDPHRDTDSFLGGVPAAYWLFGGRMTIAQPAYASYIKIGQLDPRVWDTTVNPPVRK